MTLLARHGSVRAGWGWKAAFEWSNGVVMVTSWKAIRVEWQAWQLAPMRPFVHIFVTRCTFGLERQI